MSENQGFVHENENETGNHDETTGRKTSVDIGTSTTQVIIESDPPVMQSRDCWNTTCDVFGTRQAEYINQLRPIRSYLIRMQEALKIFQYELERDLKTKQSSKYCYQHVKNCVLEINHLCMHGNLNIPPSENEMLRAVAYELSLLARIIQEVALLAQDKPRSRSHSFTQLAVVTDQTKNGESTSSNEPGIAPVDQESLKNKISKTFDLVENLIKYIDKKTERRWWLRDVINFMQAAVKIALFISAAISVAYHENQIAPIVTLVITCIQGVVEGLDQYFLKNKNADEIHISLLTSNTANKVS